MALLGDPYFFAAMQSKVQLRGSARHQVSDGDPACRLILALADQNYAPNPDIHPTDQTPPTFLVQAEDDPVHVENAVVYFLALKNAKVPAELHIYAQGGHGFGLRRTKDPITGWPELAETWLHTIGVIR